MSAITWSDDEQKEDEHEKEDEFSGNFMAFTTQNIVETVTNIIDYELAVDFDMSKTELE